jgi:1-aminocyclopropane-1-carboxylate deaminase
MAWLIDLVSSGGIPRDSTVLYAHLDGQPALNAFAGIFD